MPPQTPSLASLSLRRERPPRADDVGWGNAPSVYRDQEIPMAYALLMRRLDQRGGEFRGGADAALWAAFDEARDLTGAPRPRAGTLLVQPNTLRANAAALEKLIAAEGPTPTLRYARADLVKQWRTLAEHWRTLAEHGRPLAGQTHGQGTTSTFFRVVHDALTGRRTSWRIAQGFPAMRRDDRELGKLLERLRQARTPGLSALHSLAFEPDSQLLAVADPQLAELAFARLSAAEWWATPEAARRWSMRAAVLLRALVPLMYHDEVGDPEESDVVRRASALQDLQYQAPPTFGGEGSPVLDRETLLLATKTVDVRRSVHRDPFALVSVFGLITQYAATEHEAMYPMAPGAQPVLDEAAFAGVLYRLAGEEVGTERPPRPGTEALAAASGTARDLLLALRALTPTLGTAAHAPPPMPDVWRPRGPYPWVLLYLLQSPILLTRGAMLLVLNAFGDTATTDATEEAYNETVWPREDDDDDDDDDEGEGVD
jgi:hypothetical protein